MIINPVNAAKMASAPVITVRDFFERPIFPSMQDREHSGHNAEKQQVL
jgi:hypothetical protein